MGSLVFHFKTSVGMFVTFFFISVLLSAVLIFFRVFAEINLNRPLNYSDMASIYSSVTPISVFYNTEVVGSEASTKEFIDIVNNTAAEGTLNLIGQDLPAPGQNMTEYNRNVTN